MNDPVKASKQTMREPRSVDLGALVQILICPSGNRRDGWSVNAVLCTIREGRGCGAILRAARDGSRLPIEKNATRPSYLFIIGAERICFNLNGYQPLVFTEPTRPLFFFGVKGCTIEPNDSIALSNTNAISTPAR